MMMYLSYFIDYTTPSYGNKNLFETHKASSIANGDIANNTTITTTVHIGTHIDMPYHFYNDGQTIEDFDTSFWYFTNILFVQITPQSYLIQDELINKLNNIQDDSIEILIVKTGICDIRDKEEYWSSNYGFSPQLYDYLLDKFPNIRVFGFDSISVSSFTNRLLGREAHYKFLNPKRPILLLEDMNLVNVDENTKFDTIIIAPMLIKKCDGLPCTIIASII